MTSTLNTFSDFPDKPSVVKGLLAVCLRQSFYFCANIMTKKHVGRKGLIELTLSHYCSSLKEVRTRTQAGQEAEADAEAVEGCYLLACFPWLVQPVLL